MTDLKFDEQFSEGVEYGYKKQTVRPDDKGLKAGDTVNLCTSNGTGGFVNVGTATISMVSKIRIETVEMFLNGNRLPSQIYSRDQFEPTDNEFAEASGFEGFTEMRDYYFGRYQAPFDGVVLYWD